RNAPGRREWARLPEGPGRGAGPGRKGAAGSGRRDRGCADGARAPPRVLGAFSPRERGPGPPGLGPGTGSLHHPGDRAGARRNDRALVEGGPDHVHSEAAGAPAIAMTWRRKSRAWNTIHRSLAVPVSRSWSARSESPPGVPSKAYFLHLLAPKS